MTACLALSTKYSWNVAEQFVWEMTCASKTANFNTRHGILDLYDGRKWNSAHNRERTISSLFLEQVLFNESLRDAVPRKGVWIVGALFDDSIDLGDGAIPWDICLCDSRFEKSLNISGLRADRNIILDESFIVGELVYGDRVGLKAQSVRVEGDLRMRNATMPNVDLNGAKVGGRLNMNEAVVGTLPEDLSDQRNIQGGAIRMDSASIGGDLFLRRAKLPSAHVSLVFTTIGSNVDFSHSILGNVDMTGSRIGGELRIVDTRWSHESGDFAYRGKRVSWEPGPGLFVLRNSATRALVDTERGWPQKCESNGTNSAVCIDIELDGFSYSRLGGFGPNDQSPIDRGATYFVDWLARDKTFSPQPYEHLHSVLRGAGALLVPVR